MKYQITKTNLITIYNEINKTNLKICFIIKSILSGEKEHLIGVHPQTQRGATLIGFEASPLRIPGVVPFCYINIGLSPLKGVNNVSDNKLYESKYSLLFKVVVYSDKIVLQKPFGVKETYPFSNIASIDNSINGVVIQTNSGRKTEKLLPWNPKKRNEFYDLVTGLFEKGK